MKTEISPSVGTALRAGFVLPALLAAAISISAQSPGEVDLSFNAGSGVDGWLEAVLVQPDGRILIAGGVFDEWDGMRRPSLVRLHPDGTVDDHFVRLEVNTGIPEVRFIEKGPGETVMIGGGISVFRGEWRRGVFRLHAGP